MAYPSFTGTLTPTESNICDCCGADPCGGCPECTLCSCQEDCDCMLCDEGYFSSCLGCSDSDPSCYFGAGDNCQIWDFDGNGVIDAIDLGTYRSLCDDCG